MPGYYGLLAAFVAGAIPLLFVSIHPLLERCLVEFAIHQSMSADSLLQDAFKQDNLRLRIRDFVDGRIDIASLPVYARSIGFKIREIHRVLDVFSIWGSVAVFLGCSLLFYQKFFYRIHAQKWVERLICVALFLCAFVVVGVTFSIIFVLFFEAVRFFSYVQVWDFLFGMEWNPQIPIHADQAKEDNPFGLIPVFAGTLLVVFVAMLVALPAGIFTAIYLREYAGARSRRFLKPVIEVLAGIPTIVYGFFAVLMVMPVLRDFFSILGVYMEPNSALVAGGVMGIMIIPFVSSLTDSAFARVSMDLRNASLALGATCSETVFKVVLPAAFPGVMSGILLAVSRAIGETMIVVMAAGLIAKLTLNPLNSVTTVTVQIVTLLIGDTAFDNPKTLAAFALGLVLFIVTFVLNILAFRMVKQNRVIRD
jgi:phosphate transport system permease protein